MEPKPDQLQTDIFGYLNYRQFLLDYTKELKDKTDFNLREFARTATIRSPGYLKMVIEGRRNLTPKTAEKFCLALKLEGKEREYFEKMVLYNQTNDPDLKRETFNDLLQLRPRSSHYVLEKRQSRYFSRPHYVFIREMVVLQDFREDYKWIAKRCYPKISPAEAKEAVETLLELGLLKRGESGKLLQTEQFIKTDDRRTDIVETYHFHEAMIDRARHALGGLPHQERNYYALTLPLPKAMYDEIVDEFYAFRDKIVERANSTNIPLDEVFQINFQLFPVTRKAG